MDNELGEFLEKLRGKMSLREASKRSGLSHTYIRDLELGVNRVTKTPIQPTPETLRKLADAYDYSYDILMKKAGYIEDNKESAYALPESEIERVIKEAEEYYKVNLHDDPVVLAAVRQMIQMLAEAKAKENR